MSVIAKPGDRATPEPNPAPEDRIAELRRLLITAETRIAAEVAAREEQEKLARTMARAARTEAAEGEALARDATELRSLLKAQQEEHAAARREIARQRAEIQEIVDTAVTKRLAPELERGLAEARSAWDEDRKHERTRLSETWKHEAEQRSAAAEAAWREEQERNLAHVTENLNEDHKKHLTAARIEWEQEHDAAIGDRDRYWRERLDREIKETRAAMEKIWARAGGASDDDAASAGMRNIRDRLNVAANRRKIHGYRIAVLILLLALGAAFFLRYPLPGEEPIASGATKSTAADRAAQANRKAAPAKPGIAAPSADDKSLRPLRGAAERTAAKKAAALEVRKSVARAKALESELSAMRKRLEAEEKRANTAEYQAAKAEAARKKAMTAADRANRAQSKAKSRAVIDLEAEVQALRKQLEDARAATALGQAPE